MAVVKNMTQNLIDGVANETYLAIYVNPLQQSVFQRVFLFHSLTWETFPSFSLNLIGGEKTTLLASIK